MIKNNIQCKKNSIKWLFICKLGQEIALFFKSRHSKCIVLIKTNDVAVLLGYYIISIYIYIYIYIYRERERERGREREREIKNINIYI